MNLTDPVFVDIASRDEYCQENTGKKIMVECFAYEEDGHNEYDQIVDRGICKEELRISVFFPNFNGLKNWNQENHQKTHHYRNQTANAVYGTDSCRTLKTEAIEQVFNVGGDVVQRNRNGVSKTKGILRGVYNDASGCDPQMNRITDHSGEKNTQGNPEPFFKDAIPWNLAACSDS